MIPCILTYSLYKYEYEYEYEERSVTVCDEMIMIIER